VVDASALLDIPGFFIVTLMDMIVERASEIIMTNAKQDSARWVPDQ
jgi:hypothetical protein